MAHATLARLFAPLALAAAVVAVVIVVTSTLSSGSSSPSSSGTAPRSTATSTHGGKHHGKKATPRTYTIQSGDNLSSISADTGVPISRIERLNPTLDPNALRVGEKLKLAP